MYAYADVQHVHLELTSRCNAACPQCPRNLSGGAPNPTLPLTELSLDEVRAIFPVALVKRLKSLYLCGNYGDPMVARDALPVLAWLRSENPRMGLGIHTNGSGRDAAWWTELAGLVTYCRFGIDGLADTNVLYRRGTSWDRIMDGARAFIAAGGNAEWDFILFEHNEHQVDEASRLARALGFRKFFVKQTSRFYDARTGKNAPRRQVFDRRGKPVYAISPPTDVERRNAAAAALSAAAPGPDHYRRYLETAKISCRVATPPKIYVSAEGLVLPCCFLANLYPPNRPPRSAPAWKLIDALPEGKRSLDARAHPIGEIIDGPLFQRMVPDGWRAGSLDGERLEPCARVCGEHDLHGAQYAPSLI